VSIEKDLARFWARVNKNGPVHPVLGTACWIFGMLGHPERTDRNTYARFKGLPAHRWAYKVSVGPIPAGLLVCHRCDVPKCVRPDHLFVGTHMDNMRDMVAKGRQRAATGPRLGPAIYTPCPPIPRAPPTQPPPPPEPAWIQESLAAIAALMAKATPVYMNVRSCAGITMEQFYAGKP